MRIGTESLLTRCSANAGFDIFDEDEDYDKRPNAATDPSDFIVDIREYDVPYHVRVAIDKGMFFASQSSNGI
jgi:DNA polymerase epsilon subunit 1